jgi:2-oxoglutarate dehydrogenase E2 component (dihydrolipoamide succinyltransferase)
MPTEVVMPQMGESIAEGTVTKWYKEVGEKVERDEPLFEISTDKIDTEIPAPASGVLEKILVQEGETVAVETVVAIIGTGEAMAEAPAPTEKPASKKKTPVFTDTESDHFKEATTFQRKKAAPARQGPPTTEQGEQRPTLSPAVLSLAAANQIPMSELLQIPGTGAGGRIRKKDVKRYVERRRQTAPPTPAAPPPGYSPPPPGYPWQPYPPPPNPFVVAPPWTPPTQALVPAPPTAPAPSTPETGQPPEEYLYKPGPEDTVVPMSTMRKKIADDMIWSQRISAQVTSFSECDMHRIVRYRDEHQADFEVAEGIPMTFLPFVAEATIKAIKDFPIFNASALTEQIVMKKHVHLGVAVALDEGLIVPVVRHADEMNFVGLARAMHDMATRARNKELSVDEVQGATFTITNPGMFGGLTGTPMISQPQVAILGLGAIQKKPVVVDDAIAIRPIMVLALTFDHRIIDGSTGFQFIERVRLNLEHFELP